MKRFNKRLIRLLKEKKAPLDICLSFLMTDDAGLDTAHFSKKTRPLLHAIGVYNENGDIKYPLYNKNKKDNKAYFLSEFDWVKTEYIDLFTRFGRPATNKREAQERMMELFSVEDNLTKEVVLAATEKYLSEEDYPRRPHYFIKKNDKGETIRDILTYTDQILEDGGIFGVEIKE